MGRPHTDITGQRFGMLTVVEYIKGSYWMCKCDCGKERIVDGRHLRSGRTKSCGCQQYRKIRQKGFKGCSNDCFNCEFPDCKKPSYMF